MKNMLLFIVVLFVFYGCSNSEYIPINSGLNSNDIILDLTKVPFTNLSDYRFFKGNLKNLNPESGLLSYAPASALFSNYAKKKRFV